MQSGKPESFQTSQLLLAKGQSHFGQLPRGTVVRVAAGAVTLVQRISLERCMLTQQTTLPRGAVHGVAVSAWVEIVAEVDADVLVMEPRAVSVVEGLRGWLAQCGKRMSARSAVVGSCPSTGGRGAITQSVAD